MFKCVKILINGCFVSLNSVHSYVVFFSLEITYFSKKQMAYYFGSVECCLVMFSQLTIDNMLLPYICWF